ncbi:tyrosine-type recombinase/integrase [soil metagenome]
MPKLTQQFIDKEAQPPSSGQTLYADSELPGFYLRVTPRRKFFLVQWRTIENIGRSVCIGSCEELSVDTARIEARQILNSLSKQIVSEEKSGEDSTVITLRRVFDKYMYVRTLRPLSRTIYRQLMNRCLGDWLDTPIVEISKNMIETRHRELCRPNKYGGNGQGQANHSMKLLRAVLNFAIDHYETSDGQPIIMTNPVRRLSQNKSWYRVSPRQSIIQDHQLGDWYKAVMSIKNRTVRDYLLLMLLTGLRRNEAATLRWSDINFDARVITVRAEISKNHREHRLPMSPFIYKLLFRRLSERKKQDYVFHGQRGNSHIKECRALVVEVRTKSKCPFLIHDLRRTFLTMAERLDVPHYALKKLANHIPANDVTAGYIVIDVERLRLHMCRITDQFLALLFPDINDWQ